MNEEELNCIQSENFHPSFYKGKKSSHVIKNYSSSKDKKDTKQTGVCYPLDMWFILASYIKPEQIQTFSCICRGSYQVVNSFNSTIFWINLYKRYITETANLPICLQQDSITKRPGLKSRVVRALFFAYPYLSNRGLTKQPLGMAKSLLQQLLGLPCRNTWYKIESTLESSHAYFFRFQLNKTSDQNLPNPDKILCRNDRLNHNNEDDRIILQVKIRNFTRVQFSMDNTLLDFSVDANLGSLKMVFGCLPQDGCNVQRNVDTVFIKAVSGLELLRWWHPSYPHRD